jgi:hypothetical protein
VVAPTTPALFSSAVRFLDAATPAPTRQVLGLDEKTYAASLIPLKDFSGRQIASLAIVFDASPITDILRKNNAITFAISMASFILVAALVVTLVLRRARF